MYAIPIGTQSNILRVIVLKPDGTPNNDLVYNTTDLLISILQSNASSPTTFSEASGLIETITTCGTFATPTSGKCRFKIVDATNCPGLYEIQFSNAHFEDSSNRSLIVSIAGAADVGSTNLLVQQSVLPAVALGTDEVPLNVNVEKIGGSDVTVSTGPDDATYLHVGAKYYWDNDDASLQSYPNHFRSTALDASGIIDANLEFWRDEQPAVLSSGFVDVNVRQAASVIDVNVTQWQTVSPQGLTGSGFVQSDVVAIDGNTTAATILKHVNTLPVTGAVLTDGSNTASHFLTSIMAGATNQFGDSEGGSVMVFLTGNCQYQARRITSNDMYGVFNTEAFTTTPADGDTFIILGRIDA